MLLVLGSTLAKAATDYSDQITTYHISDSVKTVRPTEWNTDNLYSRYLYHIEMPKVNDQTRKAILLWVNGILGNEGKTDDAINSLIRLHIKNMKDEEAEFRKDMTAEENDNVPPYEYTLEIKVETITDRYVTLTVSEYQYLGGAHGMNVYAGQTFRLSDGKQLEWDDLFARKSSLRPYITKAFNKQPRDERPDWSMIYEYTNTNAATYPMPDTDPWIDDKMELNFIYQAYEIAPYAYGSMQCSIPVLNLRTLLKPGVRDLLAPLSKDGLGADGRDPREIRQHHRSHRR